MIEKLKELVKELLSRGVKSEYKYRTLHLQDDTWGIEYQPLLKRLQFWPHKENVHYWDVFLDMNLVDDRDLHSDLLLCTNKTIQEDMDNEDLAFYSKALKKTMEEK